MENIFIGWSDLLTLGLFCGFLYLAYCIGCLVSDWDSDKSRKTTASMETSRGIFRIVTRHMSGMTEKINIGKSWNWVKRHRGHRTKVREMECETSLIIALYCFECSETFMIDLINKICPIPLTEFEEIWNK